MNTLILLTKINTSTLSRKIKTFILRIIKIKKIIDKILTKS